MICQVKEDKNAYYFIFVLFSLSTLTFICSNILFVSVLAFPSFVRQEIKVSNTDEKSPTWVDIGTGKSIEDAKQFFKNPSQKILDQLNNLTNLQSVSYTSNGRYLNTTFWLSNPFETIPQCGCTPSYIMLIDADSKSNTGSFGGIDYMAQILWNNKTNNWTYDLEEFSSTKKGRVIEKIDNYTGFFTKEPVAGNTFELNNKDVYLPLNLNKIGPIIQGKAIFSVEYDFKLNNKYYSIGDFSKWVPIPPPKFTISTLPNGITIRPSNKQNIEVIVESNDTSLSPHINLGIEKSQGLTIENLTHLQMPFPPNGIAKFPLIVTYNDTNTPYIRSDELPIFVNITYPLSLYKQQLIEGASTVARSYITLSLLPPLSIYDIITTIGDNLTRSINGIITLIIAIAGGVFAIWRWLFKNKVNKINIEKEYRNLEKIFCRYCGNLRSLSGDYCAFCGRSLSGNFTSMSIMERNSMKQCIKCRYLMDGDSIFCLNCGIKLQR